MLRIKNAILATASIAEAISYYRLLKEKCPNLKVTALFDSNIDNDGAKSLEKEDCLEEIMNTNLLLMKYFKEETFSET